MNRVGWAVAGVSASTSCPPPSKERDGLVPDFSLSPFRVLRLLTWRPPASRFGDWQLKYRSCTTRELENSTIRGSSPLRPDSVLLTHAVSRIPVPTTAGGPFVFQEKQHPEEKKEGKAGAAMAGDSEPFPLLTTAADRQLHSAAHDPNGPRRRRKSSILGSELRVGDTGAPSLATGIAHHNGAAKVCLGPGDVCETMTMR